MNELQYMFILGVTSLVLVYVLWTVYVTSQVANFKQKLHEIRTELFELANQKGLGLDAEWHLRLRGTITGIIDHAEYFTLWRIMFAIARVEASDGEKAKSGIKKTSIEELTRDLRVSHKDQFLEIQYKLACVSGEHFVKTQPVSCLLLMILGLAVSQVKKVFDIFKRVEEKIRKYDETIVDARLRSRMMDGGLKGGLLFYVLLLVSVSNITNNCDSKNIKPNTTHSPQQTV